MQAPASGTGDKIDLNEVNGSLLYITVHELVRDIQTDYGPTDAIRADVAVLDGEQKGEVLIDALIFPSVLRRQLAKAVGQSDPTILGRLTQGTAKKGQSAPWILEPPDGAELAIGTRYEKYAATQAAKKAEPIYGDEEPF